MIGGAASGLIQYPALPFVSTYGGTQTYGGLGPKSGLGNTNGTFLYGANGYGNTNIDSIRSGGGGGGGWYGGGM